MLQIITGKFFTTDELTTTHHRGVLYTNYENMMPQPFETVVGTLYPASTISDIGTFIYEVDERLEAVDPTGRREMLVSVTLDSFIDDVAAVMSFGLNATFTPNIDLARRLTQSQRPSGGVSKLPHAYVSRVFDKSVRWNGDDAGKLQRFIDSLVGLERKNYNAVMRAIRRYVYGLHRIADDLDLAYSLLVASIESLAQDFDDFQPEWSDYAQEKRQDFDKALKEAPEDIANAVRNTLLKHEHIALRRRFQHFAERHLIPSYFREDAQKEVDPIRRCDVPIALENAYRARSTYVHSLRSLPDYLTAVPNYNDTIIVETSPYLTFHGLARLARQVIFSVVETSPKVNHEDFNYRAELPNIIRLRVAEQYWIWQADGYNQNSARNYLTGFLSQLSSVIAKVPDAVLSDIRTILSKIEQLVPGLAKPEQRLPHLLLYVLYHQYLNDQFHMPNAVVFTEKYNSDFEKPSLEGLILYMLAYTSPGWSLADFTALYELYMRQRYAKAGIRLSPLFETALTLYIAELNKEDGDIENARRLVSEAVENLPKHQGLRQFEASLAIEMRDIDWRDILLPSGNENAGGRSDAPESNTANNG